VVVVGDTAWSLALLRSKGGIEDGGVTLTWEKGQNSALDAQTIVEGRDVGNVVAQRAAKDIPYDVTFAFVFHAFKPKGRLVLK
jgi:hypothetical protein